MQQATSRNMVLTPHKGQCRICHFAGYSNMCEYFITGKCLFVGAIRDIKSQVNDSIL